MSPESSAQWARQAWSAPLPPPPFGWEGVDERGFGALHHLAWAEAHNPLSAEWVFKTRSAIERGASVFCAEHEMGNTPLHWCVWQLAPRCAWELLLAGARASDLNRNGETATQLARRLRQGAVSGSDRGRALDALISMLEAYGTRSELQIALGLSPAPSELARDREQGRL